MYLTTKVIDALIRFYRDLITLILQVIFYILYLFSDFLYTVAFTQNVLSTEWPFICWYAIKKLLTYSLLISHRCILSPGLGVEREVNLEPGLFEWLGWYLAGVPKFMTSQEFRDAGLPVCAMYSPVWPMSKYNIQETTEQFYDRCYQVTRDILKRHESEGMLLMCVCGY